MLPVKSSPPPIRTRIRPTGNTAAPMKVAKLPHAAGALAVTRIASKNPRDMKAPAAKPRVRTVSKGEVAFL
ncbi:hypothetical protein D3C76_1450160 [compost metagenome]